MYNSAMMSPKNKGSWKCLYMVMFHAKLFAGNGAGNFFPIFFDSLVPSEKCTATTFQLFTEKFLTFWFFSQNNMYIRIQKQKNSSAASAALPREGL